MSEEMKPECFGKMDLQHTGDCSKCEHDKECWELSFGEYQHDMEA